MNKKHIKFLRSFSKNGIQINVGETRIVKVLQVGFVGGFDSIPSAGVMDGSLRPAAIVEFESGKILCFEIDYDIYIIADAK